MSSPAHEPDSTRFYWKPGCSSCLRTKEFLLKNRIAFESINAQEDPDALRDLQELGARGLPVIARGRRYTLCQSFPDVLKFLELENRAPAALAPAQLFEKLDVILTTAARLTRQFPADQLGLCFRNRNRTQGALAFHVFRVVEMGIGAARHEGLQVAGYNDLPPTEWSGDDIADWGLSVRGQALAWWQAQVDRDLAYSVDTYYGAHPLHEVLERMTWHAAQHTRQLALMLESAGVTPERPLDADDLRGLPLPDAVWG